MWSCLHALLGGNYEYFGYVSIQILTQRHASGLWHSVGNQQQAIRHSSRQLGMLIDDASPSWCSKHGLMSQVFPKMANYTNTHKMTGVGNALKRHYQALCLDYELAHPDDLTKQVGQ